MLNEILKIRIRNYRSFVEEEIDFSSYKGMNLVNGINNDIPGDRNGCGKTQAFDSIVYAIYGRTLNEVKKENIPNRTLPINEKTELILDIRSGGVPYKIIRGLTGAKSKVSFLMIYKYNDATGEYDDITKSSIKESQKFIERSIICCDISIFMRSVLLTADQSYNFFKLSKNDRNEFLEHIFDLKVWRTMYDMLHRDNLSYDKTIFGLTQELKVLQDTIKSDEAKIKSFDDDLVSKKSLYESNLTQAREKLEQFTKSYKKPDLILEDVNTDTLSDNKKQIDDINAQIYKLDEDMTAIRGKLHQANLKRNTASVEIKSLEQSLNKQTAILSILCDDCSKKIDDKYKLSEIKSSIKANNELLVKIATVEESLNKKIENLNGEKKVLQSQQKKLQSEYSSITDKINRNERIKQQINNADREFENSSSALTKSIQTCEFKLKELDSATNPFVGSLTDDKSRYDAKCIEVDEVSSKINHFKYIENLISPNSIKKLVVKDLVKTLNTRIQYYMSKIGSKFTCVFDDELNYVFYTDSGITEYNTFSTGEQMRLSIATSFAFRDFTIVRNNLSSNILILDEYIDSGLDSSSINRLMVMLKEMSITAQMNVFIISHRSEVGENNFNNIITVEKTNKIAKIKRT